MKPKHKGRPSEVWTPEQRRRLSTLMKSKHNAKMAQLAEPKRWPDLTPEEVAEIEAEQREQQKVAAAFANDLRLLVARSPPDARAVDLFKACGIDDKAEMREVSKWLHIAAKDPDLTEQMIDLDMAMVMNELLTVVLRAVPKQFHAVAERNFDEAWAKHLDRGHT